MDQQQWNARKVVIVGAGAVGSTFAYALAQSGAADEIAIIDASQDLARGQVLDLAHGLPFFPRTNIFVGEAADYREANVIVITAGAKQQPGESRLALLQKNIAIIKKIARDIAAQDSSAVVVVTSNPVDILTYALLKELNWEAGRVIGSGTVLDSARFRYLISRHCDIDVHNVHAYILGEHGDSEFAAWSLTHIAGIPISEYCPYCGHCDDLTGLKETLENEVRKSAYHIIDYKGSTYFAIGLALVRIATAILRNERGVLTVSTLLDGEYGIHDVCLSVPCIIALSGRERIVQGNLLPTELQALAQSADVLRQNYAEIHTAD